VTTTGDFWLTNETAVNHDMFGWIGSVNHHSTNDGMSDFGEMAICEILLYLNQAFQLLIINIDNKLDYLLS
jgi:hypothetical protein